MRGWELVEVEVEVEHWNREIFLCDNARFSIISLVFEVEFALNYNFVW